MGDGNLSNPNGRAVRLRITCDTRYQDLLCRIRTAIQSLLPHNKVSIVRRTQTYVDVSCYSNQWERWLGWKAGKGPKYLQQISVPRWIQRNKSFTTSFLQGLIESDGSIYSDRGYPMVNFVTTMPALATSALALITNLGFKAHLYKIPQDSKVKYTIRILKDANKFIKCLNLSKS